MAAMVAILDFRLARLWLLFIYKSPRCFPSKFGVNWPFSSGGEVKIDFQDGHHGGHLGFPIGMILAFFDLQVTLMLS